MEIGYWQEANKKGMEGVTVGQHEPKEDKATEGYVTMAGYASYRQHAVMYVKTSIFHLPRVDRRLPHVL